MASVLIGPYGGVSSHCYGQRYTSTGEPLGPEFRINTYTTSFQPFSAVASVRRAP
jgi:hypothetical protein